MRATIGQFDWDAANLQHIARHGVLREEVEEIILGEAVDLGIQHSGDELRFTLIGETSRGRILVVVYTERAGMIRPLTSYPPGAYLLRRYLEEKGAQA